MLGCHALFAHDAPDAPGAPLSSTFACDNCFIRVLVLPLQIQTRDPADQIRSAPKIISDFVQILVGDPRQLEATSEFFNTHISNANGGLQEQLEFHSRSAMQRLTDAVWPALKYSGGPNARAGAERACWLRTQYRMAARICDCVDRQFYGGRPVRSGTFRAHGACHPSQETKPGQLVLQHNNA